MDGLSQINIQKINEDFGMFSGVLQGVKQDTQAALKDFIMLNKTFGEAITDVFKSMLDRLAGLASEMLTDQLFGWLMGGGKGGNQQQGGGGGMFGGDKGGGILGGLFGGGTGGLLGNLFGGIAYDGGMVGDLEQIPNFAGGGMVSQIAKGMDKERAMSGLKPHLIIANEGERVLTPEETKYWNQMKKDSKAPGYAEGGMVGMQMPFAGTNSSSRGSGDVSISIPVTVNGGSDGDVNVAQLKRAMEAAVQETIKKERRPGGSLGRGGLYDR
jgi:hypothetical protein